MPQNAVDLPVNLHYDSRCLDSHIYLILFAKNGLNGETPQICPIPLLTELEVPSGALSRRPLPGHILFHPFHLGIASLRITNEMPRPEI
jgi:hypothetical protein